MNEIKETEEKLNNFDLKQDSLFWEWNEDGTLGVLWILETNDGKYYQKRKDLNVMKGKQ